MSASSSTLRLDVVAAHGTAWDGARIERFRSGVSAVVERVEHGIRAEHASVRLRPRCVTSEQASVFGESGVITCAVAVVDITECDQPLALFVGRLQGSRVPYIAVCRADAEESARRIGLSSPNLLAYKSMDELFHVDSVLQQELLRAVPQSRIHEELIYKFWFQRGTSTIWVVCPQIHEPGEFATRSSPDYTYLDNLGDTDALLELMVFLSQYYPSATIERFSSGDLPQGHTSSNLVVIGGPGSAGEITNQICREMMGAISSRAAYSSDCEQMTVTVPTGATVELRAEYRTGGQNSDDQRQLGLSKDHGYFARFENPLNANAQVLLINGIHTAGVLGAARAFSERREALRNFHAVLSSGATPTNFECHFEVPVLNGQVRVPVIDPRNIFTAGRVDGVAASIPIERRAAKSDGRSSVKILFVAGDRGGAQVCQVQIPKEYDAIQSALRACEHRDLIALTNPILGATREKLAEAYRDRPAVIHFAGHGNDRSLSIIEDHGILANETPLDAEQLSGMLRTMQNRVRLCVLNACASEGLARRVAEARVVDCAIGWPAKVSDSAAIAFSRALYAALGDGRTIADALDVAKVACGSAEPVLVVAEGCHSDALVVGEGDE